MLTSTHGCCERCLARAAGVGLLVKPERFTSHHRATPNGSALMLRRVTCYLEVRSSTTIAAGWSARAPQFSKLRMAVKPGRSQNSQTLPAFALMEPLLLAIVLVGQWAAAAISIAPSTAAEPGKRRARALRRIY